MEWRSLSSTAMRVILKRRGATSNELAQQNYHHFRIFHGWNHGKMYSPEGFVKITKFWTGLIRHEPFIYSFEKLSHSILICYTGQASYFPNISFFITGLLSWNWIDKPQWIIKKYFVVDGVFAYSENKLRSYFVVDHLGGRKVEKVGKRLDRLLLVDQRWPNLMKKYLLIINIFNNYWIMIFC